MDKKDRDFNFPKFKGYFISREKVSLKYINLLIDELFSLPEANNIGGLTSFIGTVRDLSDLDDKLTEQLEIEYWEENGDSSLNEIAQKIGEEHKLIGLRLVHVHGKLNLKEPIVFIAIASIHRKEAFKALERVIDMYKNQSPVWKKEIYSDGSSKWITTANSDKT